MTAQSARLLRLDVKQQPPWTVLKVAGELAWESRDQFDDWLQTLISRGGTPHVCLDLSGLNFCDSSGIASIMRGRRDVMKRGGSLILQAPQAHLLRILTYLGLAGTLPIVNNLTEVNPFIQ